MVAGSSALLRPSPAPLVRAAVLGMIAFALATPAATAASHAPDPSPANGLLAPDPYPAQREPVAHTTPVRMTTVPVYIQRLPVRVQTPAAMVAPKQAHKAPKAVVETIRIPDHAAPQLVALAHTAVDSSQHPSRKLVLALGALVLLSASLVAGAARELAR